MQNEIGLRGIAFVEFSSVNGRQLEDLWFAFGFSEVAKHSDRAVRLFKQNEINILLSDDKQGFAAGFAERHGPSAPAMGWWVDDPVKVYNLAIKRGATAARERSEYKGVDGDTVLAIEGVGGSLIYLLDAAYKGHLTKALNLHLLVQPRRVPDLGFTTIDHLTNNVEKGEMQRWSAFYKRVFGFEEVRYFDIKGVKTGLKSYALRSPDGSFCIPINEGTEDKSQINEYLREYRGAGIQHLAFQTNDIIATMRKLSRTSIETLDIDHAYYEEVFERVPGVSEDKKQLKDFQILIDGDEKGYLLQIFTKNIIGPIFIEIIQRKNHDSFGEGNFGALFRSIERDQEKRGVL